MSSIKKILLVCTGNSCRSVMAAGLLRQLLQDKGNYQVMTAGVAALKGMPPTPQAIKVMSEHNIDISEHLSQPLSDEMLQEANLILVMETRHRESILKRLPEAANRVHLLSEFGRSEREDKLVNPDIPDPIGKPIPFYRYTFTIIKEGIERTVNILLGEQNR